MIRKKLREYKIPDTIFNNYESRIFAIKKDYSIT